LENHSHSFPQLGYIDVRRVDIHAIDADLTRRNMSVIDQVVHPIKATQKSRFSAAGRPNELSTSRLLNNSETSFHDVSGYSEPVGLANYLLKLARAFTID
jgi:hypothetical protein